MDMGYRLTNMAVEADRWMVRRQSLLFIGGSTPSAVIYQETLTLKRVPYDPP